MVDDQSGDGQPTNDQFRDDQGHDPKPSEEAPDHGPVPSVDAYAVISYLLSGVILYGGIGWLLDWWLGTRGFVGAGIALGAAAGVWLVWLRYGRS